MPNEPNEGAIAVVATWLREQPVIAAVLALIFPVIAVAITSALAGATVSAIIAAAVAAALPIIGKVLWSAVTPIADPKLDEYTPLVPVDERLLDVN